MPTIFRKRKPLNQLPKHCDICLDPIQLYHPFYTLDVQSYFNSDKFTDDDTLILCPECYRAYGDFLEKESAKQLHIREIRESMHPDTYPSVNR